jgi:cyclic pyranopterin phosphate synthase
MVNVAGKRATARIAVAEARLKLPRAVALELKRTRHVTGKGPVFDTAIIAGVMGAKRTHELIPFCHPLGLENCTVEIANGRADEILIRCTASVRHKTGVEMEALTGATIAALTVYDMCKALSHDIEITGVRLLAKSGGRRSFTRKAART